MFGQSPIIPLRNTDRTRICHKCKGKLFVASVYVNTSLLVNEHRMELDCLRCKIKYYLEDDELIGVQTEENVIITRPFF